MCGQVLDSLSSDELILEMLLVISPIEGTTLFIVRSVRLSGSKVEGSLRVFISLIKLPKIEPL